MCIFRAELISKHYIELYETKFKKPSYSKCFNTVFGLFVY